jgi:hypothetical protein
MDVESFSGNCIKQRICAPSEGCRAAKDCHNVARAEFGAVLMWTSSTCRFSCSHIVCVTIADGVMRGIDWRHSRGRWAGTEMFLSTVPIQPASERLVPCKPHADKRHWSSSPITCQSFVIQYPTHAQHSATCHARHTAPGDVACPTLSRQHSHRCPGKSCLLLHQLAAPGSLLRCCVLTVEGVLGAIVVNEGERANVGAAIAFIAETDADLEAAKAKGGSSAAPAAAAPAPAPAAPAPAAAAPPPPPPPAAAAPAPAAPAAPAPAAPAAPAPAPRADGRVIATPYAKQLAKDLRVDLATVGGTGPSGRITASDVERAAKGGAAPAAPAPSAAAAAPAPAAVAPAAAAAAPAAPAKAAGTTVSELLGTTKPFTTLQSAVARNMNESLKVGHWHSQTRLEVLFCSCCLLISRTDIHCCCSWSAGCCCCVKRYHESALTC